MDVVATPIRTAIELFETTLAEVRFPDVDAKTLARAAADVDAAGHAVASAQAALESARLALQELQDALLGQVQRALAYARIYAENNEALMQRLNAISLPRGVRLARSKDDAALVLSSVTSSEPNPRRRKRRASVAESEPMPLAGGGSHGIHANDYENAVADR
jgi:hypothetical protein